MASRRGGGIVNIGIKQEKQHEWRAAWAAAETSGSAHQRDGGAAVKGENGRTRETCIMPQKYRRNGDIMTFS
jgi:hypothetical protein